MKIFKWLATAIGAGVLFFGLYKLSLMNPEVNALGILTSLGSFLIVFAQIVDEQNIRKD